MSISTDRWDLILVGGGLANGLIAYRLAALRPELKVLIIESGSTLGGNHTWSFHETDLSAAQLTWTDPFVAHRWSHYHVAFPAFHRRLDLGYRSVTSDRFHAVMRTAGVPMQLGAPVAQVEPRRVVRQDGSVLDAAVVIDGRGYRPTPHLRIGYQKFLGQELQLGAPHRLTGPLLMDATVPQADGYRFVYVLPFAADRLMIEDTYYSDTLDLDSEVLSGRIADYARSKGWIVDRVVRDEHGVLPITLAGDIDAFWAEAPGQPRSGLRAGLFHPTTGYSWAEAVRLADRLATLPSFEPERVGAAIEAVARAKWRDQRFFRALNRMLFQAGTPDSRWTVMRRFYGFPEATIERFYAGSLSPADKVRLLMGKPPVPIGSALRALMDYGLRR